MRPPRTPGGSGGRGSDGPGRPPSGRPPSKSTGPRPPSGATGDRRPSGATGGRPPVGATGGRAPANSFGPRPAAGAGAAGDRRRPAASGPRFGRAPELNELSTNAREVRRHIPGGRLPKVPAARDPNMPTGRRARGQVRAATAAAGLKPGEAEPQRIAKLLARAGIGSRRDIERMIEEGKISLHGKVLDTPATIVTTLDGITVEGREVQPIEAARLFRFHKPAGFLTTARDPGGRPTIFDALPPGLPRLVPVGRLDMNTEGLLLMTTDGGLKRALELPVNAVSRRYRVRAYGEISQNALESLIEGITIDGMRYGPIDADIERRTGANLWLTMRLTEGKNREIRRVLEFLGLQVSRLIRTAYGPFELGELPPRDADEIPADAIATLRKGLGRS